MMKRLFSLALAVALYLSLTISALADGGFTDVDPNAYYAEAVN